MVYILLLVTVHVYMMQFVANYNVIFIYRPEGPDGI